MPLPSLLVQGTFQKHPPIGPVELAQWRNRLQTISPHNDQTSYLHLVWEPGWPWEPVGRWMLFDCVPSVVKGKRLVAQMLIDECEGDDPANLTSYDPTTNKLTGPSMINHTQWQIYREVGRFSRPWWVIQGNRGGHKLFFTPREQQMLKLMDLPLHPPAPGELDYAPFDNRVMENVIKHDKLMAAYGDVVKMHHTAQDGWKEEDKKFRAHLMKWLAEQVNEPIEERVKLLVKADAPRIRVEHDPVQLIEESMQRYIETGR